MTKIIATFSILIVFTGCQTLVDEVLVKSDFKHYVDGFNNQDDTLNLHFDVIPETRMISNENTWAYLKDNIPFCKFVDIARQAIN